MSDISVGTAGGGPPARVDPMGTLRLAGASWQLEWWIGAQDRWRVPANEVAVRQRRVGDVAVVETAMRVPGGDAVQRVYGVAGPGNPIVVEVENASPAPFVLAHVVRGAGRVAVDGAVARVDRAFAVTTPRAPSRWARATGSPVLLPVSTGRVEAGPFPGARDRAARLEVALLHPVAHRTSLRAVVSAGHAPPTELRALPDAEAASRGWASLLARGMQADIPDPGLAARVRRARCEVVLRAQARVPGPMVVAALEDWGLDDEARAAWRRLGTRDRRRAASRPGVGTWSVAEGVTDDAEFLLAVRRLLVDDGDGEVVRVCADWPRAWRGRALEVRDAPLAGGTCSYAVRWHGARAALLWDVPPGVTVLAPGLDPGWSSARPRGEALLGALEGAG